MPPDLELDAPPRLSLNSARSQLANARWLSIRRDSNAGAALHRWLLAHAWRIEPDMELESFDLIVNLVALGTGVAFVPHRVLPIYERRRVVRRVPLAERFSRELHVLVRKGKTRPTQVDAFVAHILF